MMRTSLLICAISSVLLSVTVHSAPFERAEAKRTPFFLAQSDVTKQEAAARAKKHPSDKVLKVEQGEDGDGAYYRVKILGADGRVHWVHIDKRSGKDRRPRR